MLSAEPAQRFARLVLRPLHDRQHSYGITSDIKGSAGICQHFLFSCALFVRSCLTILSGCLPTPSGASCMLARMKTSPGGTYDAGRTQKGQAPSHRSLAPSVSYSSYSNDSGSTVILIGSSFQMSLTYSWMVLSEENFPLDAIFRIALFAQSLWL